MPIAFHCDHVPPARRKSRRGGPVIVLYCFAGRGDEFVIRIRWLRETAGHVRRTCSRILQTVKPKPKMFVLYVEDARTWLYLLDYVLALKPRYICIGKKVLDSQQVSIAAVSTFKEL